MTHNSVINLDIVPLCATTIMTTIMAVWNTFFFFFFLFCTFIFVTHFLHTFHDSIKNWKVAFSIFCSTLLGLLTHRYTYDFRVPPLCDVMRPNGPLPLSFCSFVLQPQSYEAVEPLDLEEFLMSQLRSGDASLMQELGEFPDDDLKVEQFEKECRTVRHSVPKDGWVTLERSSCYLTNFEKEQAKVCKMLIEMK